MKPMYTPSQSSLAALHMENELLAHENRLLRARLDAAGAVGVVTDEYGNESITQAELQRLRKAENDLRWFLTRLDQSPVGPVLRRWAGFRTLCERYRAGAA